MEIEKRILKYKDGSYAETYHKKGDIYYYHRENGPAYIEYRKDGSIRHEAYWINNKLHRANGPAYIQYNRDGSIEDERYYINSKKLSKEEWEKEYGWKSKLKNTPMEKIY